MSDQTPAAGAAAAPATPVLTINDLNDLRRQVVAGTLKLTPDLARQILSAIRANRGVALVEGQPMPATRRKGKAPAMSTADLLADLDKKLGL